MGNSKKNIAPVEPELQIELLEQSFEALAPSGEKLVKRFYEELFKRYPEVKPLFANADIKAQQKHLLNAIVLVVNNLRKPEKLLPVLKKLGEKHQQYGAVEAHYPAVAETLLDVMAELAGELWTDELHNAWAAALNKIANIMLEAYQHPKEGEMAKTGQSGWNTLTVMMNILDNAPMNIMMADAEENIVFVNKKAIEVLTKLESELAKYLPGFKVSEVIGGSIHRYHKNPAAIKDILKQLRPGSSRKGEITPGPYFFEHETRPLFDDNGDLAGYVVQWVDVTEQRKEAEVAARLQGAIDNSATAMMVVNRDFVITYANRSTFKMIEENIHHFEHQYPGFKLDKLLGSNIDIFHKNPKHQRKLLSDPDNLPWEADIKIGEAYFKLNVTAIYDAAGHYVGNNLEWANITREKAEANRAESLFAMINGAASFFMMCDKELNITYANPSLIEMLRKYEDKFRIKWPGFSVDDLIGKNIDTFHKKPSNQRRILGNVSQLPHRTEIKVGELEFGLNATALFDASGNQIGNAVEWLDLNARAVYRNEVNRVISALKNGDLSVRGNLAILDDVFGKMMQGINEVIDSILEPISELQQRLPKIAEGDLTAYVTGEYMGDHAQLKNSLNTTLDSLNSILTQVAVAVDQISSGSLQVSDSSQSLSQGATEQASSLEEISASMNQLTAQTRQNAENAAQANKLAAGARDFANTGNRQMGDMLNAMDEINKSSTQISKIIKAIDEIAFQTNLLALNAAVEAARAGVHGKGFAVVAEEVRNLAQRSAKAAKETTELIEDSIKRVQNGTNIANETAGALGEIVNQVTKVTDLVGEIDVASKEQAQGIGQINEGLSQIDKVTQSNTASAEETAASAEELSGQSSRLKEMLGKFKLKIEEPEAWNGQLPNGITPELLMQMLRQLQSQGFNPFQSQPVKKSAPETAWGSAPAKRNAPAKHNSGKSVDPSSIISLDDDDFGKF